MWLIFDDYLRWSYGIPRYVHGLIKDMIHLFHIVFFSKIGVFLYF